LQCGQTPRAQPLSAANPLRKDQQKLTFGCHRPHTSVHVQLRRSLICWSALHHSTRLISSCFATIATSKISRVCGCAAKRDLVAAEVRDRRSGARKATAMVATRNTRQGNAERWRLHPPRGDKSESPLSNGRKERSRHRKNGQKSGSRPYPMQMRCRQQKR
jgi:hypothetical protein